MIVKRLIEILQGVDPYKTVKLCVSYDNCDHIQDLKYVEDDEGCPQISFIILGGKDYE